MFFGAPFSINVRDRVKLLNCKTYSAETSFLLLRASPFHIHFPSEFHVFSSTAPGRHCFMIYIEFVQTLSILEPLHGIQNSTKDQQNQTKVFEILSFGMPMYCLFCVPEIRSICLCTLVALKLTFGTILIPTNTGRQNANS